MVECKHCGSAGHVSQFYMKVSSRGLVLDDKCCIDGPACGERRAFLIKEIVYFVKNPK
jgi:hypothetical protein